MRKRICKPDFFQIQCDKFIVKTYSSLSTKLIILQISCIFFLSLIAAKPVNICTYTIKKGYVGIYIFSRKIILVSFWIQTSCSTHGNLFFPRKPVAHKWASLTAFYIVFLSPGMHHIYPYSISWQAKQHPRVDQLQLILLPSPLVDYFQGITKQLSQLWRFTVFIHMQAVSEAVNFVSVQLKLN